MDKLYEISSKYIFPSNPATGTLGSIDLNMYLIQLSGIPLFGAKVESKRFKIYITIYGVLVMTIMTFFYTSFEMHDLILSWTNLNHLTQNTCLSLTHVTMFFKLFNVLYRRKDILRIIEQFKYLTRKYVISDKQKEAFYRGEFENKVSLIIYTNIVVLTGIMAVARLLFDHSAVAGNLFPYRVKLPQFIPHSLQIVYMSVAVIVCGVQIVGMDYLNVALINQIRYQMIILNIAFDDLADKELSDVSVANKAVKNIVEHHNLILRIRREIESIFKFLVLMQFLTTMLIFAMTGFQATVQADSSGTILIYFYCACICSELFVYCWFGNEVSEQNKTLASRGYNSSWYNFDHRYRKSLMIFLVNAQSPFYFTAGGFFDLSLLTFSRILSKSYTFITLLRQLYSE